MDCPVCDGPVDESSAPSDDFCSEDCQRDWTRAHWGTVDLREPADLANSTTWRW